MREDFELGEEYEIKTIDIQGKEIIDALLENSQMDNSPKGLYGGEKMEVSPDRNMPEKLNNSKSVKTAVAQGSSLFSLGLVIVVILGAFAWRFCRR